MQEIEINGTKVLLMPVIKGLMSEAVKVREAITERHPSAVAVSMAREEVEGLRAYEGDEIELGDFEEVYKQGLEQFGEVQLPPPCYTEALKVCTEMDIPFVPVDMNEELFSDRYCELIGGFELVKEGFFSHRVAKKKFNLDSAEAFVLDYDKKVNGGRGIMTLNIEREEHMAKTVADMSVGRPSVLVLVELERSAGVLRELEALGSTVANI